MNLTKNFTLEEMIRTSTGSKLGLDNTPNEVQISNMRKLLENVVQPIRDKLGIPITVTSGFRSESVNKAVKGKSNSQHLYGEAVDITCSNNKLLFEALKERGIYDQLIDEKNLSWVHVSYREGRNRKECFKL